MTSLKHHFSPYMEHLPVKALWVQRPTTHKQVFLQPFYWPSRLTCTVFVSEMATISHCSKGANRARKQCMGRGMTQASGRGLEWEAKRGRVRRSGIIRSLYGPLKRLRGKPTDGPLASMHLRKDGTSTGLCTHSPAHQRGLVEKADKQVQVSIGVLSTKIRWRLAKSFFFFLKISFFFFFFLAWLPLFYNR